MVITSEPINVDETLRRKREAIEKPGFRECGSFHDPDQIIRGYQTFWRDDFVIHEQVQNYKFAAYRVESDDLWLQDHIHTGETELKKDKNGKWVEAEYVIYPVENKTTELHQILLTDYPVRCNGLSEILAEIETKRPRWLYVSQEDIPILRVQIRIAISSWFLFVFEDPKIQERVAGLLGDVGTSGGGKKRFLSFLKQIAYRPIYMLNTNRIPSMYRLLDPWGYATLLIDEADQKDTGSDSEFIQYVNSRYDGTPIPRFNVRTQKNDVFRSFGLTAVALRRMPIDEGFTSRLVKTNATISPVELDEIAGVELYNDFEGIRRKLLYLRLKYYGKIKFVGRSGLPADHSWRGKETLTLFRMLSQIDESINQDIEDVSLSLTRRERENLAGTWDGLIINEVNGFINDEQCKPVEKKGSYYFIREWKEEGGEKRYSPLTLSTIAKNLGTSASDISRSLRPLKVEVFDRFRIDGIKRPARGVLSFRYLEDTDRIFQRYIPNYNHILKRLQKDGSIDSYEGEVTGNDPDVPLVPLHYMRRGVSNDQTNNNNSTYACRDGTSGTGGTDKVSNENVGKDAKDIIIEILNDHSHGLTGNGISQNWPNLQGPDPHDAFQIASDMVTEGLIRKVANLFFSLNKEGGTE